LPGIKCDQCGLVNLAGATQCERCHTPLAQDATSPFVSNPQGIVLEDGYVLPPPPTIGTVAGVWRDKTALVMSKDARLPDRCIKCNQPTQGRLKRNFSWHHPAIYILLLVAWLIYLLVAMFVRKRAIVDLGLCDEHQQKRRRNILIMWGLLLLGVVSFFIAIAANDGSPALLGLLLILGGMVFGIVAARVAVPSKIDDRFVWLKGINKDYLDLLPQWPGS